MANYGNLKAVIDAYIKRNGQQRITGDLLNSVLNAAVDALGAGYQFMGIATTDTDPGTPDARVFYVAGEGTYPNFGSTEIPDGGLGFFCYGNSWDYLVLQIGGGGIEDAVLYTPQTLTSEQKAQARSNIGAGTGNGTYSKPSGGIPSTDLASGVQTSLEKADTAYQLPSSGIPKTDLAEGVQDSLEKADNAYQKPETGIPATDMASGVIPTDVVKYVAQTLTTAQKSQARSNIGAGTYTKSSSGIPASDLASGVQTSLDKADSAYQKPSTGIPATDLASGVIPAPEIFWATYGTTTAAEIDAAVAAGKQVFIIDGGWVYTYAGKDTGYHYFFAITGNISFRRIQLQISNNGWARHDIGVQGTAEKAQTISGNESDTNKYPSTKAVAESIANFITLADLAQYAETWTFTMSDGTSVTKKIIVLPQA